MSTADYCSFPSKRGVIDEAVRRAGIARDVAILLRLDKKDSALMRNRTESKIAGPRQREAAMRRDLGACMECLSSAANLAEAKGDCAVPVVHSNLSDKKRIWTSFVTGAGATSAQDLRWLAGEMDAFAQTCEERARAIRRLYEHEEDASSSASDYSASSSVSSSDEEGEDDSSRSGRWRNRKRTRESDEDDAESDDASETESDKSD